MTWWKKRLDQLRRDRHDRQEQPVLQLPLPEPREEPDTREPEAKPERGIAVIDFSL